MFSLSVGEVRRAANTRLANSVREELQTVCSTQVARIGGSVTPGFYLPMPRASKVTVAVGAQGRFRRTSRGNAHVGPCCASRLPEPPPATTSLGSQGRRASSRRSASPAVASQSGPQPTQTRGTRRKRTPSPRPCKHWANAALKMFKGTSGRSAAGGFPRFAGALASEPVRRSSPRSSDRRVVRSGSR